MATITIDMNEDAGTMPCDVCEGTGTYCNKCYQDRLGQCVCLEPETPMDCPVCDGQGHCQILTAT
jgi:hypothetical protein